MASTRAAILGTGSALPAGIISNAELERLVDTSDAWIRERTGIRERRRAGPDESTFTLALAAARLALEEAAFDPAQLDLVIVATVTPDYVFPATACLVQDALGAKRAGAFDLEAACSGFVYATGVAAGMIGSGISRHVLVVGAETLTRVTDYRDRGTCILFGDGAGAALFGPAADGRGVLHTRLAADGGGASILRIPAGGSKAPASCETVAARQHYMQIEGRKVFKFATTMFVDLVKDALDTCGLAREDVALVVPHQVNERIIEAAVDRLEMPRDKFFTNIDRYGNTSSASVPIALDEARRQGRLKPGDVAILVAFGAGLTWASAVVRM
jgi:3-oxoacyl-[acyl-carrier-protein] synthase-3